MLENQTLILQEPVDFKSLQITEKHKKISKGQYIKKLEDLEEGVCFANRTW